MKKTKLYKIIGITVACLLALTSILLITYFFTFILIRPFDNTITQDRPVMEKLCELQLKCESGEGKYRCSSKGRLRASSVSELEQWSDYNGCNESTDGFSVSGDFGYILVKSCSCGSFN